jgi:hypothetical protein
LFATIAALTGVLTAEIIYGTDVFCALVQRPALARLDDATMAAVMGRVHEYGDRRLPVPGVIGILAAVTATATWAVSGSPAGAIAAGTALIAMLTWLGRPDQPGAHRRSRRARDAGQCPGPAVPLGQHHHGPCAADGGRRGWPCLQRRCARLPDAASAN